MLKSSKYYVAKNYAISEFFELTHMLLEIILVCSPRDSLFEFSIRIHNFYTSEPVSTNLAG
jgi:hypothetical protein